MEAVNTIVNRRGKIDRLQYRWGGTIPQFGKKGSGRRGGKGFAFRAGGAAKRRYGLWLKGSGFCAYS